MYLFTIEKNCRFTSNFTESINVHMLHSLQVLCFCR